MIENSIKIPERVEIIINGDTIKAKGPNGEVSKKLGYTGIEIKKEDSLIVIKAKEEKRMHKRLAGTFSAHINNMIKGVTDGFEYKMKAVHSHFPMTIKVSGNEVIVENFLGEKTPRKTKIVGKASLKVKGAELSVFGNNLDEVSQTAANIEQLTKVRDRDRRVFQDGIYTVERNGVPI